MKVQIKTNYTNLNSNTLKVSGSNAHRLNNNFLQCNAHNILNWKISQ